MYQQCNRLQLSSASLTSLPPGSSLKRFHRCSPTSLSTTCVVSQSYAGHPLLSARTEAVPACSVCIAVHHVCSPHICVWDLRKTRNTLNPRKQLSLCLERLSQESSVTFSPCWCFYFPDVCLSFEVFNSGLISIVLLLCCHRTAGAVEWFDWTNNYKQDGRPTERI